MTDTANAPERIWTADTTGNCSVGFNTPSLDYKNEYISRTHCDKLVAAAYVAASEKAWVIAVEMELHAAIGSTTKAKAEAIEGAILSGTPDNARAALVGVRDRRRLCWSRSFDWCHWFTVSEPWWRDCIVDRFRTNRRIITNKAKPVRDCGSFS